VSGRRARLATMYRSIHLQVARALKSGRLTKPSGCSKCGAAKHLIGHHDDYSRPFDVRWLCRRCHWRHHREHGPGLPPKLPKRSSPPVRYLEHNGRRANVAEWARLTGINLSTLRTRLLTMPASEALNPDLDLIRPHARRLGKDKAREILLLRGARSSRELAEQYGVSMAAVQNIWSGRRWPRLADELAGREESRNG